MKRIARGSPARFNINIMFSPKVFDEFNRLEERILSAVSQQVQSIQQGLAALVKNPNTEIELVGKNVKLNKNMGQCP